MGGKGPVMQELRSRPAPDQELSVDGSCPEPVLRTARALRAMSSGQILRVICRDPASVHDLQVFSEQTGNRLLAQEIEERAQGKVFVHWLSRR